MKIIAAFLLVFLAAIGFLVFSESDFLPVDFFSSSQNSNITEAKNKQLRVRFVIKNTSSGVVDDVSVDAFVPGFRNFNQVLKSVTVSPDYKFEMIADDPKRRIRFDLGSFSPYEERIVLLTYTVTLNSLESPSLIAHQGFSEVAGIANEVLEAGKLISGPNYVAEVDRWLYENITPSAYNAKYQSALSTLKKKQGDCTDYAVLAKDLLAVKGVNSTLVGGFIVADESVIVQARSYHNWLWLNDSGEIYDPINRKINPPHDKYLAFEIAPSGESARFSSNNKNIQVLMK